MNTKNNRRRRESIARIEKAFLELLQTRELHEVTVSDICKASALNRSTFYANFVDIYDLADKVREHLEAEVAQLSDGKTMHEFHLTLLRHIRAHQLVYRTYFKLGYDNQFRFDACTIHDAALYPDRRHLEYHVEFFRCGFNAVVKMWLAGGCRETPEEIVDILRSEYQGRFEAQK